MRVACEKSATFKCAEICACRDILSSQVKKTINMLNKYWDESVVYLIIIYSI
jgi:hypothetical protein